MTPDAIAHGVVPSVLLGRTGLQPSALGLGCSRLGSTLSGLSRQDALRLVHHALDQGVTLFDTADIYGQGNSERFLGAAFGRRRQDVVLVTKAGQKFTPRQRLAAAFKGPIRAAAARVPALHAALRAQRAQSLPRDYSPDHVRRSLEGSLRRTGAGWIDLFLLHSPDCATVRQGACFATLGRLQEQGLIRHWGVSCDDSATAHAALCVPGMAVLQVPLLLLEADPALAARAASRGAGLLVREVFARNNGQPPASPAWRRSRIAAALALDDAVALIGTTRTVHLDEALAGVRQFGRPTRAISEHPA